MTHRNSLFRFIAGLACVSLCFTTTGAHASSWSPTLLVNTESFQIIDEGDSSTDIEIRFGDTLNEKLYFERDESRFRFSDDVHVDGNLSASGTLAITGAATLQGATTINNTLDTTGNITTDANLTINEDNGGADAVLTFGNDGGTESLTFSDTSNNFELSDDLDVTGAIDATSDITTDTNITINDDNTGADAVLTFGNDGGTETITFSDSSNNFEFSDDIDVTGGINTTGDITTDTNLKINDDSGGSDAVLTFGNDAADETITFSDTSNNFEISDDVDITGTANTTGNITTDANLTINEDNGGADAVLTFGNDAGAETITFSDTSNKFEFTDDIAVTGNISGSTLTIDGADVSINGIDYSFTGTQGGGGTFLQNDGAGNLTWANSSVGDGSGSIIYMSPEYPNAVYFASGSTSIGMLSASGGLSDGNEHYYVWTSSKAALNDYWVGVRVRVPDNFGSWDPVAPVQFRYKTENASSAVNHMNVKVFDTADSEEVLTGGNLLANTSWTTANITGLSGTYSTGGYMTIFVKLATTSSGTAKAGFLQLNWETSTP